jgi:hypothetical protein
MSEQANKQEFLEIIIMGSGISQTINGIARKTGMCVLAPYGSTEFKGDIIKAMTLKEHNAIVAELKAENERLYKLAQEWMHDYDKLKNKYESMIAVTSEQP